MIASLGSALLWTVWAFFVYGPQLLVCLLFAWYAAKRSGRDRLDWLVTGFLWSIVPFAGVVAMWWLWRRAGREGPSGDRSPTAA